MTQPQLATSMDCILDKMGKNQVSGWTPRCFRLRNCELISYKKAIEKLKDANDKSIKNRFNICNLLEVKIGNKKPYVLDLKFNQKHNLNTMQIKFDRKIQGLDKNLYAAWLRILSCCPPFKENSECRPMPSNIRFAMYYTLQKLYHHKQSLSSEYIFDKRLDTSSERICDKFYYKINI